MVNGQDLKLEVAWAYRSGEMAQFMKENFSLGNPMVEVDLFTLHIKITLMALIKAKT